jgi:hypothetical protein
LRGMIPFFIFYFYFFNFFIVDSHH